MGFRSKLGAWLDYAAATVGMKLRGMVATADTKANDKIAASWKPYHPTATAKAALGAKLRGGKGMPDDHHEMRWKLREMVAKGLIKPEQAREKMEAWRHQAIFGPEGKSRERHAMGWKLRKMVASGEVTAEQAREKMEAWRQRRAFAKGWEEKSQGKSAISMKQRLEKMAAEGVLPAQQAREKLAAWSKPAWAKMAEKKPD